MSFARYPHTKDSGVEWLGEVPGHWEVRRLKRTIKALKNGTWGDEPDGGEDDLICVRVADFDRTSLRVRLQEPTVRKVSKSERTGRLVSFGDLLIEKSGGGEASPVGFVVVFNHRIPAVCSNFVARVELKDQMNSAFWCYVHHATYCIGLTRRSIKQTSGIQNLDSQQYFDELCPLPPLPEQQAIADFLDHETAKIDSLVAEQKHLIELLKEKRQAVISHAVTKGLNPEVPMKDSGVEWLGEVPGHWEVRRLKHVSAILPSNVDKKTYDGQIPVRLCNYTDVYYNDRIVAQEEFLAASATEEQILKFTLRAGDTLVTKDSETAEEIAIPAYVPTDLGGIVCGYHLAIVRPLSRMAGSFITWWFRSRFARSSFAVRANGLTRVGLPQYELDNVELALPPLPEQLAIADFLDHETAKIDSLVAEVEQAITLLQERRTALISAAVTGKIDVREGAGLVTA